MDEPVVEPQIRVEELNGTAQMDAEPSPCQKDSDFTSEPYEGMEFDSEESARAFYSSYARRVGFLARISRYTRSRRDNSVISRAIVCSKEGFREPSRGAEPRRSQRVVTRVGCKAMLAVKKLGPEKWVVSKFVKEHNHGPVPPRKSHREENSAERSNLGDAREPFEGMEFESEEDARSFYIAYARRTGFRARISKYCRSRRDNSIISRQIVCSKEGFREVRIKKEETYDSRAKRPRVVTRIGCKAMVVVKKLSTGKWVVSRFEREHNHALVSKSVRLNEDSRESLTVLYNRLCYEAVKYAQEGAVSEDIYDVAMSALKEATEKVASAKRRSNEFEKAVSGKELVLMQQPVGFVLIPSTSLVNDSMPANIVDSPMILMQQPVSCSKNLSLATESADGLVSNGILDHDDAVRNSQKMDNNSIGHAKETQGIGNNSSSPSISEAQMISVPAVPVTLYMPVIGSLSESSSGTPFGSNSYALVSAPVESVWGSGHPKPELGSQPAAAQQYTSPNPQVHATAIAAGARVIPPQEAVSLIKAIEARVRTAKSALTSGCKRASTVNGSTDDQKALAVAVHLRSPVEGPNEIEVGSTSDQITDDTCDDHVFSDVGS